MMGISSTDFIMHSFLYSGLCMAFLETFSNAEVGMVTAGCTVCLSQMPLTTRAPFTAHTAVTPY